MSAWKKHKTEHESAFSFRDECWYCQDKAGTPRRTVNWIKWFAPKPSPIAAAQVMAIAQKGKRA